jgi:NADPH:quinone reductase
MSEQRNRVVQVTRFGDPDGLEVADAPLPTAGQGEVRVRVLASGVEYTDVVIRRHLYAQTMMRRPPFVMGYDDVGEIDQIGPGVSGVKVGARVADMTVVGSNTAYRTLRADHLARVPTGVDAAEAAALILSWTTAYQLLHRVADVQRGQRVLVQGAAGAVGQALLVVGWLAWNCGEPPAARTRRSSASSVPIQSTTSMKTSRASCRADSTWCSTASARTVVAARSRH